MSHEREFLERACTEKQTLLSFLSNSLILEQTLAYLSVSSILKLSATSKGFHSLISYSPRVFRHLDLSVVKSAQFEIDPIDQGGEVWRNVQLDETLTEDDFYSGPIRGIFSNLQRRHLLRDVQTLVLDGLAVPAELVHDIITNSSFNVRVLSIREVKHLNEGKLQASLRYACRPDRSDPQNTPRLKALYVFGARESTLAKEEETQQKSLDYVHGVLKNLGRPLPPGQKETRLGPAGQAADAWYLRKGKLIKKSISSEWARTLMACAGLIAFDAPLCTGPRHVNSPVYGLNPHLRPSPHPSAVATIALGGCARCGQAPEGLTCHSVSNGTRLPVLGPIPALSSTLKAAQRPDGIDTLGQPTFLARCFDCVRDRYCAGCHKWWCETCYLDGKHTNVTEPVIMDELEEEGVSPEEWLESLGLAQPQQDVISRSCWECGTNCADCIDKMQLSCRSCCGGYCLLHNEGSTTTQCDWCASRGSRVARRPAAH